MDQQAAPKKTKHYKVISICLYLDDIDRLHDMVEELKQRGLHKANKSSLIRYALDQVDVAMISKGDLT